MGAEIYSDSGSASVTRRGGVLANGGRMAVDDLSLNVTLKRGRLRRTFRITRSNRAAQTWDLVEEGDEHAEAATVRVTLSQRFAALERSRLEARIRLLIKNGWIRVGR